MKTQKINLNGLKNVLSKKEMKDVTGGSSGMCPVNYCMSGDSCDGGAGTCQYVGGGRCDCS